MKILIAPLNWGLGHATRCIPLIRRWLGRGDEVVLAGDGESLALLRRTFPHLPTRPLAPLHVRYSRGSSQVGAMAAMMPALGLFCLRDRRALRQLLAEEPFDMVVSDNRFALYPFRHAHRGTRFVYITHQLRILLPRRWQWLAPVATALHRAFYGRYDEVWVPDYTDPAESLAGKLAHPAEVPATVTYIGPLSRFEHAEATEAKTGYDVLALLSGPEPQRSMLEAALVERYRDSGQRVLIVQGKPMGPMVPLSKGGITRVPHLPDERLLPLLLGTPHLIARSGYTTVMDMHVLGLSGKVEWIPTPGQPEQEYIAEQTWNRAGTELRGEKG